MENTLLVHNLRNCVHTITLMLSILPETSILHFVATETILLATEEVSKRETYSIVPTLKSLDSLGLNTS
jgi:hypothetical protein